MSDQTSHTPARRWTTTSATRRRFLGSSLATVAGILGASNVLAACVSSAPSIDASGAHGGSTGPLRVSNWPLYISDGFVEDFQAMTGIAVDYKEDFNANEEWFAKVKEPLARNQDIGADLAYPTAYLAARLHTLGWLNTISDAGWTNKSNLRTDLVESDYDRGRTFSAPYMSGLIGIAYDRAATGRELATIDDLWDPAFKGRVSMFSDVQDALGMIMLAQGNSPARPSTSAVSTAIDLVREQKDRGQIRRFTTNDYTDDLASGNVMVAQAYAGDAVQLQADNPNLVFVVPESGGISFVDTMVIPYTTANQSAAEQWINFTYDRVNYAKLVAALQYIPVLSDMTDELDKIDPALASNPLVNPPQSVLSKSPPWAPLTDEQTQQYYGAYAEVTGA